MKRKPPVAAADSSDAIAALVRTLHETQQRLQELGGGEVDAVVLPSGHSFLMREAQERLHHSEVAQRELAITQSAILNALPAHIALLDERGVILSVNERWKTFATTNALLASTFGVSQNYLEICDEAHGDCADEAHTAAAGIRSVMRGTVEEFALEYPCHSPAEQRWFRLVVNRLVHDHPGGVVVMHINITERRQAEELLQRQQNELRVLFDLMPAMVVFKDTENVFLRVNQRFAQTLGKSVQEIEGRPSTEVFPRDAARFDAEDLKVIRSGVPHLGVIESDRDPEGNERWRQTDKVPYCDKDGKFVGLVVMAQDITDRRRTEQALRDSEEHFRFLNELAEATRQLVDPERVMAVTSRMLGEHLHASRCAYAEVAQDGDEFAILHDYTDGCSSTVGRYQLSLFGKRAVDTLHRGQTLIIRDVEKELLPGDGAAMFNAIGIHAIITCPLVKGGSLRAMMAVHQATPRDWQPAEIAIVQEVVERCWAAIGRTSAEKNLRLSEALLRIAGRIARLGGWTVELPELAITWSDEVCAILDVPAGTVPVVEQALGFYVPTSRGTIREALATCMREGTPFDLELEVVTARARHVSVRCMGEAHRDAAGVITRVQGAFQDITERKRAEEETRELAERLTTTIESLNEGFYTVDRDWRFTYVNREAERMMQHARTELLGTNLWDQFPDAVGTSFQAAFERARVENVVVRFEEFYPAYDCWFEVRIYPSAQALAVYFRDVTEHHHSREALRVSEERFRLLSKATNDAIWDWDLVNNGLWWNDGFETLFGFSRDEIEPTSEAWTSHIHPEDRARIRSDIQRTIDTGQENWSGEYRFVRKDGSYAYVLDRGYVMRDQAGRALRMIGGMTDLTERKAAADRIAEQAALLDAAPDAIILKDLEGRIVFWNRGAEKIYGWTAAEVVGKEFRELFETEPSKHDDAHRMLLLHGYWHGELRKRAKDGRTLIVDVRWTMVRDAAGNDKSVLAINTDVTERKKLEDQFFRLQRMESLGTLAGGIAHDLNNILAPILMSVGLLRTEVASEVGQEMLATLQSCSERGADLVRQVLSFARGVEGQRILVNPVHLMRDIQAIARETFPKAITFRFRPTKDLWSVVGDPTQLHQVFMNLCVNARDAMPQGGELSVAMENVVIDEVYAGMNPEAKPGPYVVVRVADTGIGIPPDVRERIFEPFYTTKEIGKGTGLGLSTTLAIIRSHAGFIQVYSEQGRGSQFRIHLPANTAVAPPVHVGAEVVESPRGNNELVLVVEDERGIRSIAKQTLEGFGFRVLLAGNGAEAVAFYAAHRDEIAVVLTDMAMPVMDGPSTIVALRAMNPRVKIIGSSGRSSAGSARSKNAGVTYFLAKPYSAEQLLSVLSKTLQDPDA